MALDSDAYNLTQLSTESTKPLLYDERLIKALYDKAVIKQVATDKSDMLVGAGDTFNVYVRTAFSTPTTALEDGATIDVTGVTHTPTQITIAYYGDAKQWTEQAKRAGFNLVFDDWAEDSLMAIGELHNAKGMAELIDGASATHYPFNSSGVRYTNADVDVDAVLQFEQLLGVQDAMYLNNMNLGTVFIDTRQRSQLMADSRLINSLIVNSKPIVNGVIPSILGFNFVVTNAVQTSTENSKTVASAVCVASEKDTFIFAEKVAPVFRIGRDSPRDLFESFVYFTAFGYKVVRENGVIVAKSVVA